MFAKETEPAIQNGVLNTKRAHSVRQGYFHERIGEWKRREYGDGSPIN